MSYLEHAKREFLAVGYKPIEEEDGPNKWIQENIFELLEVFSKQGHSGSSAPYCIEVFRKLAAFEPLCPLTGEDSEWNICELSSKESYQNNRCSHVFKENGVAYDIYGYIFRDQTGSCHTGYESARLVTFPYSPKSITIDVVSYEVNKDTNEREEGSGWWHTEYPQHVLVEREELEKLLRSNVK